MRGQKAATFRLSERTKEILRDFSTSYSIPSCIARRAGIVLLAAEGKSNEEISNELKLAYSTVIAWRNRFACHMKKVARAEKVKGPEGERRLAALIVSALSDKERPGTSSRFTQEQIRGIHKLACRNPRDFGYDREHWSMASIAEEAVNQGIVEAISPSSVQRILKSAGIEPWRNSEK